jgi:WD40 repeat protein
VSCAAFAADGRRLLTGSHDGTLRLWDLGTGQELCCFAGHADHVESVALSVDGKLALSACRDGSLRVWDTTTGATLKAYEIPPAEGTRVAFWPDGRWASSRSADGRERVWCLPLTRDQALTDVAEAIRLDRTRKEAYEIRAVLHEQALRYTLAIDDWSKVIELGGESKARPEEMASWYYRRGHLRAALEEYADAKSDLEQAFKFDPGLIKP